PFPLLDDAAMLAIDLSFAIRGTTLNAVLAAVIADAAPVYMVDDDLAMVDVGDATCVDAIDGAVVVEVVVLPVAALVAAAKVAEPIVDAAVITDLAAPVPGMPAIGVADIAPIAGRPEGADERWPDPGAGHPVIAPSIDGPIAGGPEITRAR